MELRDYQQEAVAACWRYISEQDGNPCIALPTGSGKSLVIAKLAQDASITWNGRVVILADVKELLEQNAAELKRLSPDLDVGLYSAGLNKRDRNCKVLVAGIQSVADRAFDFDPFDLIIVDEAHKIPPDGEGRYRSFLRDCKTNSPHVRLIGLTATPYRMSTGWLCGPDELLTEICYEAGVKELIQQGYLAKLTSKEAKNKSDTRGLHVRGGEFVPSEAEALMMDVVKPACKEILERTESRKSILVFCQSVDHAVRVADLLAESCLCDVALVTGDTPASKRDDYIERFKAGRIKYLVNVNVLTTGFNAPNVDCVCLLRPTLSPGLYYQMVGRGFRLAPGKENCLILDFAGNVRRHGPVDQIIPKPKVAGEGDAPTKTCPECESICYAGCSECPNCHFIFRDVNLPKHDTSADAVPITSLDVIRTEWKVLDVKYAVHEKFNAPPDTPKTMRVDYKIAPIRWVPEWICIEHEGYAKRKAMAWWRARSNDPFPASAQAAVDAANGGALAITEQVTIEEKGGDKWPRIVLAKIGEKPEGVPISDRNIQDDFDFPANDSDSGNSYSQELSDFF
jgi:DNA repair protein RadD